MNDATQWSLPLQQAAADPFSFNLMIAELLKFSLIERLSTITQVSRHCMCWISRSYPNFVP